MIVGSMVNTVGKNITVAELAYLAGLIDGDGAIMATIEPHKETRFRFRIRVVVQVTQHKPDVLLVLQDIFDCGKVVLNKTTYDWIIRDQENVAKVLTSIIPYLKVKQEQARIALVIVQNLALRPLDKTKFLEIANLADSLSKLNVRSTNRRFNNAAMVEAVFSRND